MVNISVMIEGGAIDSNTDVATVENTASLRQSFHRIFSELSGNEVKISVEPKAGYRNAARLFSKSSDNNTCLYVDLDDKKENIFNWFDELERGNNPIIISDNKKGNVFFMIQEMEAWILKQPEIIEVWGQKERYTRLNPQEVLAQHSLIAGKNIEDISKPSGVLYDIIKHFFSKEYNGKKKKIQYGKLKTAPKLLDCLDVTILKSNDTEAERFYNYVKTI